MCFCVSHKTRNGYGKMYFKSEGDWDRRQAQAPISPAEVEILSTGMVRAPAGVELITFGEPEEADEAEKAARQKAEKAEKADEAEKAEKADEAEKAEKAAREKTVREKAARAKAMAQEKAKK